jgi:tetratricopeptide (TPR) repeat protein
MGNNNRDGAKEGIVGERPSVRMRTYFLKGSFKEAENHLLKGVGFGEKINHFAYNATAQNFLAKTYVEIGQYGKAEGHYDKDVRALERARFLPSLIDLDKIGIARAKVMNNEKDIDLESLYEYKAGSKLKQFDGWTRRYIGEILLKIDDQDMAQAEDWIKKAQ